MGRPPHRLQPVAHRCRRLGSLLRLQAVHQACRCSTWEPRMRSFSIYLIQPLGMTGVQAAGVSGASAASSRQLPAGIGIAHMAIAGGACACSPTPMPSSAWTELCKTDAQMRSWTATGHEGARADVMLKHVKQVRKQLCPPSTLQLNCLQLLIPGTSCNEGKANVLLLRGCVSVVRA